GVIAGFFAIAFAVFRVNSASKSGSRVLNVAKKMMPMESATNSIGGHTLACSRRRMTSAGEMKMSITSSKNECCAGAADLAELAVESVIAGGWKREAQLAPMIIRPTL